DRAQYPHLAYPPFFHEFIIDNPSTKPDLRIDGYVGSTVVLSNTYSSDPSQDQFLLAADDTTLKADGADATRVVFRVNDKYGQPRPFAGGNIQFEVQGPGVIVGDNPFRLEESGGAAAIWIKSLPNNPGVIQLKATHSTLGAQSVSITTT
ncbi:MAG TPA: hypothetical protein VGN61_13435, partial [Verrucomicrobiae bacterium]